MVLFRRSDVVSTGDIFDPVVHRTIDLQERRKHSGSMSRGLNRLEGDRYSRMTVATGNWKAEP